jgi:small subunit ribosomal protein S17
MSEAATQSHRQLTGVVVSDKMNKTVTVLVERQVRHPVFGKVVRKSQKYHAHSEGDIKTGDTVVIEECRPLSRTKNWKVVQLVSKGQTE